MPSAVSVSGNIKWDIALQPEHNGTSFIQRHPVWVAASTHELEEQLILDLHRKVLQHWPEAMLLWAPRHPERFEAAYQLAGKAGMQVQRRTLQANPDANCQLFLMDTLGELVDFLPGAHAVFVGGSLQNIGGHNVLEPVSLGLPVIVGPHTQNFAEIVNHLLQADALIQVQDAAQLHESLIDLLGNPGRAQRIGNNGLACVAQNRGALHKTKALIKQRLGNQ
jgi:3-deoxy-D-manno-octulosonic-acid transferase